MPFPVEKTVQAPPTSGSGACGFPSALGPPAPPLITSLPSRTVSGRHQLGTTDTLVPLKLWGPSVNRSRSPSKLPLWTGGLCVARRCIDKAPSGRRRGISRGLYKGIRPLSSQTSHPRLGHPSAYTSGRPSQDNNPDSKSRGRS